MRPPSLQTDQPTWEQLADPPCVCGRRLQPWLWSRGFGCHLWSCPVARAVVGQLEAARGRNRLGGPPLGFSHPMSNQVCWLLAPPRVCLQRPWGQAALAACTQGPFSLSSGLPVVSFCAAPCLVSPLSQFWWLPVTPSVCLSVAALLHSGPALPVCAVTVMTSASCCRPGLRFVFKFA